MSGVQTTLLLFCLAFLAYLLYKRGGVGMTNPLAGWNTNDGIWGVTQKKFLVDAAIMLVAFAFLDLVLATSGWLPGMFRGWGLMHLVIYPLGLLVLALAETRAGKVHKAVLYMAIAGLAIAGIAHIPWKQLVADMGWSSSTSAVVQNPLARVCDGLKKPHHFSTVPERFNPSGQCAADFWIPDGHCIYQRAVGSNVVYGPYGPCPQSAGGSGPNDVEYVWSAGPEFDGHLALPLPRYRSAGR